MILHNLTRHNHYVGHHRSFEVSRHYSFKTHLKLSLVATMLLGVISYATTGSFW